MNSAFDLFELCIDMNTARLAIAEMETELLALLTSNIQCKRFADNVAGFDAFVVRVKMKDRRPTNRTSKPDEHVF